MKSSLQSARQWLLALGVIFAGAAVARGGSFFSDFSAAPGNATLYGNTFVDSSGGAGDNGGVLKLTTATPSQAGSFLIDDLDPGARTGSFLATFNLHIGNGNTPPADGMSFCLGTDLDVSPPFNEEGVNTAFQQTSGLVICFDTFDNTFDDNAEGPEFRIFYNRSLITRQKISNQFQTGVTGYVPVSISYTPAGTLTLVYNNLVIFTNLFVGGPLGAGARFGLGARTGGSFEEHWVDDLSITTAVTTDNGFYVKHPVVPYPPVGLSGATTFQVSLQDNGWAVDPASVSLTFNALPVSPAVTKVGGVTTIAYSPAGVLLPSSIYHVAVNFLASGNPKTLLYDLAAAKGPLWSLAPNSRPYLLPDAFDPTGGTTPLYRSLAVSPLTNHLYLVCRTAHPSTGLTIQVLDSNTGADLYQLDTTGITGGAIILINLVAADDGYIYAANMTSAPTTNPFKVYRWANDDPATVPVLVFSGDPGVAITANKRWGDTMAVRGSGVDTRLIFDCNANAMSAMMSPTDINRTAFTATAYSHSYVTAATAIGRGIDFGPGNTYFLKKRSSVLVPPVPTMALTQFSLDTPPTATAVQSCSAYYGEVGLLSIDSARNLAAGIMFVTNTASADHLAVYDISNFASPLQIAQYDFPITHQTNNNCIGKVVFRGDRIFAVDGNNGLMAVPVSPPAVPALSITLASGAAILAWPTGVVNFVLQSTPTVSPTAWTTVAQPVVVSGGLNTVTDTLGSGPVFYRLVK